MFNIEEFKTALGAGLLKPNKFKLEITPPSVMSSYKNIANSMTYFADGASIPGIQISTHEYRRFGYGPFERKPYAPTFTDLNINVLADAEGKNYNFWYKWFSSITHFEYDKTRTDSNLFELEYKDNYATTVKVTVYDDFGKEKIKLSMIEAYPTYIENVNLRWGDTNNLMGFPLTLTFFTWDYDESTTTTTN